MRARERMEWAIAYALAFISAATASLYGFMSAAGPYGYVKGAGLFGIAFIGCHGPAWIVKAKQRLGWPGAIFGVIVTAVCLAATLWGGLGTNATGGATLGAQRIKASSAITDDRAELARITREREAMPVFVPTTEEAVNAAREAVDAAVGIRTAECDKRGPKCRERETEEQTKRDALAVALTNKSATDRAAKLDADAAEVRTRLEQAHPAIDADPQASAFSQLTGIPVATSAALNALLLSFAFELGAMLAMMLAYTNETIAPAYEGSEPLPATSPNVETSLPMIEAEARAVGDVRRFMLACLPRSQGAEVTWGAAYARYQRWCGDNELLALDLHKFGPKFQAACDRVSIRTERKAGKLYCLDVSLAA